MENGASSSRTVSEVTPAIGTNDEESEYEYDSNETEDHYVVLDISSIVPRPDRKKPASASSKAAQNLDTNGTRPSVVGLTSQAPSAVNSSIDPAIGIDKDVPQPSKEQAPDLQILNFHTTNPIISYHNQFYSCTWGTTVGTDVLLAPSHSDGIAMSDAPEPSAESLPDLRTIPPDLPAALRSRPKPVPKVSIAGMSKVKLVGQPVKLVPRRPYEVDTSDEDSEMSTRSPSPGTKREARQEQIDFLTRLQEIKRAKGETDLVPIPSADVDMTDLAAAVRGRPMARRRGRGSRARGGASRAKGKV